MENTPTPKATAGKPTPTGSAVDPTQPYKSNPEVDARIDTYIQENPKHWEFIRAMPRERLERTVVLGEVRHLERQQRSRHNALRDVDRDPGLKQAYQTIVKDLPEDQREKVMAQIARTTQRAASHGARV